MDNKTNTIMILEFSIKGRGSNAKHTSYVTQQVNANTNIKELIRSLVVDCRSGYAGWDITTFKATVSTYIKEDGKDLNDYNDYDNELLNVDKYDADNTPLVVGWTNLIEYREYGDDDNQLIWQDIYTSQDGAARHIDDDIRLSQKLNDANIIVSVRQCRIEIDAYADIRCYDNDGNAIYHDFIQGYWGD